MDKFPESYESMIFWVKNSKYTTKNVVNSFLRVPGLKFKELAKWFEFTMKMWLVDELFFFYKFALLITAI